MIAHDKGKPVARQGRKAVSLPLLVATITMEREIVWLPKAIEEWPISDAPAVAREQHLTPQCCIRLGKLCLGLLQSEFVLQLPGTVTRARGLYLLSFLTSKQKTNRLMLPQLS